MPKFKGEFYLANDALYMKENIHSRMRKIELIVELKNQDIVDDIDNLFWRVWFVAGVVFVFIGIIAFVLVRLAYLPLLAQIRVPSPPRPPR